MKAPFRKHTTAALADPLGSLALILGVDPGLLRTVLLASGTEVRSLSFNGSSTPAWASMAPNQSPSGGPASLDEANGMERTTRAKG